jgi:hypothetical protein
MRTAVAAVVTILALAIGGHAAAGSVTGSWTMTVEGGPHGTATMGLVLKQDGTKVTGTFASGHAPDQAVSGELVDGVLKIETESDSDHQVIFRGTLKGDGSLAGTLSTPVGDMKWTAQRVKDAK